MRESTRVRESARESCVFERTVFEESAPSAQGVGTAGQSAPSLRLLSRSRRESEGETKEQRGCEGTELSVVWRSRPRSAALGDAPLGNQGAGRAGEAVRSNSFSITFPVGAPAAMVNSVSITCPVGAPAVKVTRTQRA